MASREQSSWRGTWGNVDGTSRPAWGLQGTSGRRPMERVGLRVGVRSRTLGSLPWALSPLPLLLDLLPAWAGHRFEDVMEWGWHVGWTGPRRGWLQGRRVGPSPPGPRPLPTPALAVDLRLANLASPWAVRAQSQKQGLRPMGPPSVLSANSGPVDQQTATSRDCLLYTRHLGRRAMLLATALTSGSVPWTGPSR